MHRKAFVLADSLQGNKTVCSGMVTFMTTVVAQLI